MIEAQLKYRVIKTERQYDQYCRLVKNLCFAPNSDDHEDEIELLTALIEKWDDEHYPLPERDPVQSLKSVMTEHKMNSNDMAELLGVSKGLVSDMLNYKKGFSKRSVRILAERFKIRQDVFNRPYKLKL